MIRATSRPSPAFHLAVQFAALAGLFLSAHALPAQAPLRTLTGTVSDKHHEPLRGAVVQVQDQTTNSVVSFITTSDGHYSFKRLSPQSDYRVWATYRNQKSRTRQMSHFDSKPQKVINFVITLQ